MNKLRGCVLEVVLLEFDEWEVGWWGKGIYGFMVWVI